ncbi:MAG: MTAP family purine nucleoside phosphorylase [Solirubrobacterales bacterium]
MGVGVITGSGTYVLPGIVGGEERLVATEFGAVELTTGRLAGLEVIHVSRHGDGHPRLSHQVNHRGNVAALHELGASCAIGLATCGGVDPSVDPGDLILFDDLYFPSNRLPDGSACTLHAQPGAPERAHWMFERPFSEQLRAAVGRAIDAGRPPRLGGCYGHVDGPRFNTRTEVRALRELGVTAIGQTAGPETVLCGEAGIPYALVGYVTGRANGVAPQSMEAMMASIGRSAELFGAVLPELVVAAAAAGAESSGVNHGFETRPDLYSATSKQVGMPAARSSR